MSIIYNDLPPTPEGMPVTITTSSLVTGNVGTPYFAYVNAVGGYPPYTWSLVSGALPTGLTLNASGSISGTPTVNGTFNFVVKVQDIINGEYSKALSIQIDTPTSPVITTNTLSPAQISVPYSQTFQAAGGVVPYVNWVVTLGSLPPGLTLSSGGVLSGTPTTPGTYVFTVQVTDTASATASQAFVLIVQSPTPVITTTSVPNGMTSLPYTTTIIAAGGTIPYTNWQVLSGTLPPGLTLIGTPTNATISGTPTQSGSFVFTVEVTDTASSTDTQTFTLTIANGAVPTIYTDTLPYAPLNAPYTVPVQAAGGSLPYTWSILSGQLPTGLALNPTTGDIYGTPITTGSFVFVVKVTDANNNIDIKMFSIVVGNFVLPSITTPALSNGAVNIAYSDFVQGSGGTLPYVWGVLGSLPTGLSINIATGEISGTPTVAGLYSFTIVLQDNNGNIDSENYTIKIGSGTTPVITTTYLPDATQNTTYSETIQAIAGTPGYTWLILSGTPPPGITLSPNGVLSGVPTAIGIYNFRVRVADALGQTETQDYTLIVKGIGFDSNCCFCVFTDTIVGFSSNADGILSASGGTVLSNSKWKAPSEPGVYIIKYIVVGEYGKMMVKNTITVVKRLTVTNIPSTTIDWLLPMETFALETNYSPEEVIWETLSDGIPFVTPTGNIVINSSPADQCFGAVDVTIRGTVQNADCTGLLNYIDIKIKLNPIYPTPDNCGPFITKWLRDGKKFNVIRIEYDGGCDETHLKNRVPIVTWTINYEGLVRYTLQDTTCPLCYSCIAYCGCTEKEAQEKLQQQTRTGCHPILQSANRLDDFWNLVYGEYKSFTLVDYDTGEIWYNVKFSGDMSYDHRHRIKSNVRSVKLIWRPCCSQAPQGGTCSTHGVMNFRPQKQDCIIKKQCEG